MGKAVTFMVWMWIITTLAGGVMQGSTMTMSTTTLTAALTDADVVVNVTSTQGFPVPGFIVILDERIGYSATSATSFTGSVAQPIVRGANDTTAVAHNAGENVRTVESSMLNSSMGYRLAVLSDSSGLLAFVTIPFALISLMATFFTLPLGFLGTDLEVITYVWVAISIGMIVAIGIQLAGGRRV